MTELAEWTSKDWRTCQTRLVEGGLQPIGKNGRAKLYDSLAALLLILTNGKGDLSPADKLATARWEMAELELAQRRGELAPVADMAAAVEKRLVSMRARILAIPSKVAPQIAPPNKLQATEDVLTRSMHEALAEIAGSGLPGN